MVVQKEQLLQVPCHVVETTVVVENYADDWEGERVLNQYTLKRKLGEGSYGVVYLAKDAAGQEFAIKEISKKRMKQRSHMRRTSTLAGMLEAGNTTAEIQRLQAVDPLEPLRNEVAILKKLDHPHVIKLYEVIDDAHHDQLFMGLNGAFYGTVFELCQNGIIQQISLNHNFDKVEEQKARLYFCQLVLGLEYLHENGIAHRDIKPDNLLLDKYDQLKIADFGISKLFSKDETTLNRSVGSPMFAAPELIDLNQAQALSLRPADIWAAGVVLYGMIHGQLPFRASSTLELNELILHKDIELSPTIPIELKQLLEGLLCKSIEHRFTFADIRRNAWVSQHGKDEMPSKLENCKMAVNLSTLSRDEVRNALNIGTLRSLWDRTVSAIQSLASSRRNSLFSHDTK